MPILPQVSLPPGMVAVPENRAKAAAFDRWLAQGGKPGRKSGKFLTGPQKGMTYDQAKQRFEGMWAGASPEIRAKYDARVKASDAMPPAAATPAKPPGQMYADQKKNRMGYYSRINGVTAAPPPASAKKTVNPAATSGAGRGKPIGTPEERAKVSQMVAEGGDYATADTGDQGMKAAVSMANTPSPGYGQWGGMGQRQMYDAIDKGRARRMAATIDPSTAAEVKSAQDQEKAAAFPASETAAKKRIVDDISGKRAAAGLPAQSADEILASRKAVSQPAPQATVTPPVSQPQPSSPIQPMGPPASAKTPATPAAPYGQPVIGGGAPKINRLTGLPFGYRPGDSTEGMDAAMKARADASTARMNSATPPPRAIPVVTPAMPPSVEQRAAAEMRRQAAINANPSTVNPDDPRKFFTGRRLPLDQLVKSQTPVRPVMR